MLDFLRANAAFLAAGMLLTFTSSYGQTFFISIFADDIMSTFALTNTTLDFAIELAELGPERAVAANPALARGANVWRGHIVCDGVAESLDLAFRELETLLPAA